MQGGDISPTEFHKVLQEIEKYRKLKANIRNQPKAKIKQITKTSKKNYLNKEEKKARNIFYKKLQTLQVPRVSMAFKISIFSTIRHVLLWSVKTIKST